MWLYYVPLFLLGHIHSSLHHDVVLMFVSIYSSYNCYPKIFKDVSHPLRITDFYYTLDPEHLCSAQEVLRLRRSCMSVESNVWKTLGQPTFFTTPYAPPNARRWAQPWSATGLERKPFDRIERRSPERLISGAISIHNVRKTAHIAPVNTTTNSLGRADAELTQFLIRCSIH
ncbi:hypothetical protein EV421DRAFT_695329 [Armillaria borealis]|uniref:Uncharacterized protein n=1 Tax=Armillaria borealis TaxID=47425 RepID=A0AA39N1E2_9AGAR|nr:hypothetical protein EV421DRAFT_695329 [Armillaria borealis]